MTFQSLEPFIPSGPDFQLAKKFFIELGFSVTWEGGGYAGMEVNNCKFILQEYDNKDFAENLMINIKVDDVDSFFAMVNEKQLPAKYNVRIMPPKQQPYGKEVNVIDIAGVCWHFVQ